MVKNLQEFYDSGVKKFFAKRFAKIAEINRKYQTPRITVKPSVKLALLVLRFYLLFLVLILIYKFITLLK